MGPELGWLPACAAPQDVSMEATGPGVGLALLDGAGGAWDPRASGGEVVGPPPHWRCPGPHASGERLGEAGHSLEHIAVELLLPVAQELADHLPAQALALQQEVGHPHWRVGHEAALDEVLDALLGLPGGQETGSAGRARTHRLHGTRSCPSLTPPPGAPGTVRAPRPAWASEGQAQSGPAQHTLTTRGQAGWPAPRGPPTPPPTAQAPDSCVASQSRDHP